MRMSTPKPITILCDTDLHGMSCGITALYTLLNQGFNVNIYSHFSTNPNEPTTTPTGLANVVENLGMTDLIILDIPVDVRNPKRFVDTLINHAQFKGKVLWLDHHGHSQWVDILNKNSVIAIVYGSSYDLSLAVPRMYNRVDSFVEKWALLGALADFDTSIANRISREFEEIVCDVVDSAYKQSLQQIKQQLNIPSNPSMGNIGELIHGIVTRRIETEQFIEVCKQVAKPIPLPQYTTLNNVVYTTQIPQSGLAWKTAWKLCCISQSKVAIVPTFNPRTNQYAIIIATYWRNEEIKPIIEEFIKKKFTGRQIVGHFGARSIALFSQSEIETIPQIARELDEFIQQRIYRPRITHLISDSYVAEALAQDFKAVLNELKEIHKRMTEMYKEYLELKRRQVELLERSTERERTRYD